MPIRIVLRNLTPETKIVPNPPAGEPVIATRSDLRDGTRQAGDGAPSPQGIVFQENFDTIDWHSGLPENDLSGSGRADTIQRAATHTFPANWYSSYQNSKYAPDSALGEPGKLENIHIDATTAPFARSGTRCFQGLRESYTNTWNEFVSDGQLGYLIGDGTGLADAYIEFYIRFSPEFERNVNTGNPDQVNAGSKIFRIESWNLDTAGGAEYQGSPGGNLGPRIFWDYLNTLLYGVRNFTAFRGGPHGDNYNMSLAGIDDMPGSLIGNGDADFNWTSSRIGMAPGGTTADVPDRLNGGVLPTSGTVTHAQVFGGVDEWTKLAFRVKMNSAPGARDGIYQQWINDLRVMNLQTVPWMDASAEDTSALWNWFTIGGNDFYRSYPNSDKRQERYWIDDLTLRDSVPETLL